ncbi:MAG TPA: type VII secretion integral membrane protein EccD [Actinophytocola sp.]|jgi:type VII secretion integral membrane protein EccD|uniref:type VII secretion integral membrane protein EccD n=1 Tax=Actinophytocola sp. TaxID=1872138 RepID=UPI002DFDAFEF|nr:type VII secretion integral membrane protein EccD [Actinophytocola sp.]
MTTSDPGDLCHLTVVGPHRALDVALPAYVVLAELQPGLLRLAGEESVRSSSDGGGWVLQRLGEEPLDIDLTSRALGLRDGDTVYLRPSDAQLPPADFDDMADGVATAVRDGAGRWRPAHTGVAVLAVAGAGMTGAGGLLLAPGPPLVRAGVALALAVLLGVASVLAGRILSDGRAAAVFGVACVGTAVLAGYLLGTLLLGSVRLDAPALVTAAATGAGAVGLLALGLPPARGPALGVAAAVLLTVGAGVAGTGLELSTVGTWALALVLAVAMIGALPRAAAWIAKLRIPPLPASFEQLREYTDPEPGQQVLDRAAAADRHVAAMAMGLAAVAGGALAVLGSADQWGSRACALLGACVLLLQARAFVAIWPRVALIAGGATGLVALLVGTGLGMSAPSRSVFGLALVAVAAAVVLSARSLEGRRLMPRWGWFGDLFQTLAVLSLLPLAGVEWGLYAWAYSLGG